MDKCPVCGSTKIYPSRHRGAWERTRQLFTDKQPFRCHACNWRRWLRAEVHIPNQPDLDTRVPGRPRADRPMTQDELDGLDLPGADRAHGPRHGGQPLPPESFDRLDPDAAD